MFILATGLGPVTNQPPTGQASSSSQPIAPTEVTIGGMPAEVFLSVLAGFVALYQVIVQVPENVTRDPAVPVVLIVGGVSSKTVTMAIAAGAVQTPTTLSLVSGDNQTGTVGTALANPFVVKVTDANGDPVAGVAVTFAVTAGSGAVTATQVDTDAQGLASSTLTLGPNPGVNTVTAATDSLAVTFNATAVALPSALTVAPQALSFSAVLGAAPERQAFQIGSDAGTVNWTASVELLNGSGWLTISPTSGTATLEQPATVTVEVNFAALAAAGVFQAVITVTDTDTGFSVAVPVAVVLSARVGRLLIDLPAVVFTAASTATGSLSQTLRVINEGEETLDWSISAVSGNLPAWLTISPSTGTAGAGQASTTTLAANPEGLGSGVNQVLLGVSAPGANNDPQLVTVTLRVVPADTPASADVSPYGLLFVAEQGGVLAAEQELTVSNVGGGALTVDLVASTSSGGDWLMVSPSSGTASGSPFTMQVSVNQTGLEAGVYRGTLTGTFSSGPPQVVEVLLIVTPLGTALRAQAGGLPRAAQCTPTGLELLATTIGNGLSLPVSFPRVLIAVVVDNCGGAVDNATVVASVEGLSIPLRTLGAGFYSGTWVPQSEAAEVTATFAALHPDFTQVQRSFTVSTAAPGDVSLPVLFADGVVEGAGFTPLRPLAPGGIISLFGERFASGNHFPSKVPLERELGGVSVRVGGQDAPLFFVGPGQINAQMPFKVNPGDSVPVAVSVGGLLTAPQNYLIAPVQPGIFELGGGQGAVSIANTLILVAPVGSIPGRETRPAESGEFISIFCTGLGATSPTVEAGEAGAAEAVTTPVTATIGGVDASVAFAGLAPLFVGLYQVNAVVPVGVVGGPAVPLVITQDGIASNTVTIAIE